jgi:hypothetical protein
MDIITDLTSQSVSFVTVLQDICRNKRTEIRRLDDDNAYLGDVIDFSKIRDKSYDFEHNNAFETFKERIQEIVWSSTGEKETIQSIRCFFEISERLLLWIQKLVPPTNGDA